MSVTRTFNFTTNKTLPFVLTDGADELVLLIVWFVAAVAAGHVATGWTGSSSIPQETKGNITA